MKIGLAQYDIAWCDKEANKRKIRSILESAIDQTGLEWLIFPEMSLTGFSMEAGKTTLDQEDVGFFGGIARELKAFVTFGGVAENQNRAITLDREGRPALEYSKIHLFSYSGEDEHYTRGDATGTASIGGFAVTPIVCYDLRFTYLFWKNARQTDIFAVIANWPASRRHHWRTLLTARAIENQCYAVGVNRRGKDPAAAYAGDSLVIDPMGVIVLDCGDQEGLFTAEISAEAIGKTRQKFPFLRDRLE